MNAAILDYKANNTIYDYIKSKVARWILTKLQDIVSAASFGSGRSSTTPDGPDRGWLGNHNNVRQTNNLFYSMSVAYHFFNHTYNSCPGPM
jgi:hypothetical protein